MKKKGKSWVPIDKKAVHHLPKDRAYSNLEALFSYTLDRDNGEEISISMYSKTWSWSRTKVRNFIKAITKNTEQIRDRRRTDRGHPISFIDSALWTSKNTKRTDREQIENTSFNPNPKPKEKTLPTKSKIYADEVRNICNIFYKTLNGKLSDQTSKQKNDWLDAIEKCHRIDGYSYQQIEDIVIHFRNDSFWAKNFLTPLKLRKLNNEGVKYIDVFSNSMEIPDNVSKEELALKAHNKKVLEDAKREAGLL